MISIMRIPVYSVCLACLLLIVSACGPAVDNNATPNSADPTTAVSVASSGEGDTTSSEGAYPGSGLSTPSGGAYPGPEPTEEGMHGEPPNPERELPAPEGENAVIGGVLIREVVGEGFVPLMPKALLLGEIVAVSTGDPAYVRTNSSSPSAQVYPTGIFIFRNVPPGTYGLAVDLGYTQYLVKTPNGDALTFTVEAGQVLDLGQVITQTPG